MISCFRIIAGHCRAARRCVSPATCMASFPWGVVIVDESHNLRTTNSRLKVCVCVCLWWWCCCCHCSVTSVDECVCLVLHKRRTRPTPKHAQQWHLVHAMPSYLCDVMKMKCACVLCITHRTRPTQRHAQQWLLVHAMPSCSLEHLAWPSLMTCTDRCV